MLGKAVQVSQSKPVLVRYLYLGVPGRRMFQERGNGGLDVEMGPGCRTLDGALGENPPRWFGGAALVVCRVGPRSMDGMARRAVPVGRVQVDTRTQVASSSCMTSGMQLWTPKSQEAPFACSCCWLLAAGCWCPLPSFGRSLSDAPRRGGPVGAGRRTQSTGTDEKKQTGHPCKTRRALTGPGLVAHP